MDKNETEETKTEGAEQKAIITNIVEKKKEKEEEAKMTKRQKDKKKEKRERECFFGIDWGY
jgi:hypothetical protein